MHANPFSPSFSIRPERFFGRLREIDLARTAFENPDSPNRFLFLTGTRGCGKTSLLHQFALVALHEMGWTALETTYRDCLEVLSDYAGIRTSRRTAISLAPSVSVGGVSASAFELERNAAITPDSHVARAFTARALKEKGGILVTIDEVQKISEQDMEEVCHAVQSAKTAGAHVALVIAGLPSAYAKIRRYSGCTFVQRMRRLKLGMLGIAETGDFLKSMFALVPELDMTEVARSEMAEFSGGHPYLLQLIGNYAYEVASEYEIRASGAKVPFGLDPVREAERRAIGDYRENVLRNLLIGLRGGSREYLRALCDAADEQSIAHSADVAQRLGKTTRECSSQRARIIDLQLAMPAGYGLMLLALPYLALAFEDPAVESEESNEDSWIPRKLPIGI